MADEMPIPTKDDYLFAHMKEKIFNLFVFVENETIVELGACCHECVGSDRKKLSLLQELVHSDHRDARRFPVPKRYQLVSSGATATGIHYQSFVQLAQM